MFNQKLKYLMYLLAVFSVGLLSTHLFFGLFSFFNGFIDVSNVKCQYPIAVITEFRGWLVWLAAKTRSPGTSGATETATSPDNAEKIRKK
jgi:hypothetical protein